MKALGRGLHYLMGEPPLPRGDTPAPPRASGLILATGVKQHSHADRGADLYETPPEAVHALLRVERIEGAIWEPACGPGSIVRALRSHYLNVYASDLYDYGCPNSTPGMDFTKVHAAPEAFDWIVTNPPFSLAAAFVRQGLRLVPNVAMLLRLQFLESTGRSDILEGGELARVYPFRDRLPMMHRAGWVGPKVSSAMAFAWFVFKRGHNAPATIQRISWRHDD